MNQVLQFVRGIDPKLVSMEKTPGWQDIEDLKKAIEQLKTAKSDLASQGRLEEAKSWAIEAEKALKADPKLSTIVTQANGTKLSNTYQPGERALKRLYVKLLYALDRELPAGLRLPFKHLPVDPRPQKLLADARKLVADQEKRFESYFATSGFPDDASLRTVITAQGGAYKRLLDAFDHDQFEFAMNRPEGARWWVPKVGFVNQRTTGSSKGTLNPEYRDSVESKLTGTKYSLYKGFDNELKPEYGYLRPTPDFGLKQSEAALPYGDDIYIFKKSRVRDRVTWTAGDSFGVVFYVSEDAENPVAQNWQGFFVPWKNRSLLVPEVGFNVEKQKMGFEAGYHYTLPASLASPPPGFPVLPSKPPEPTPPAEYKAYADALSAYYKASDEYYTSEAYTAYLAKLTKDQQDDTNAYLTRFKGTPLEPFKTAESMGYIELQYFGPLGLDDIEIFQFGNNPPSGGFLEELRKRKIKIRDGRQTPAIEWNGKSEKQETSS